MTTETQLAALQKEIERLMDAYWGISGHNRDEKRPIYSDAIMAKVQAALVEAEIAALRPIDDINRKIDADTGYGELDAQEDIEAYVDNRLAQLSKKEEQGGLA